MLPNQFLPWSESNEWPLNFFAAILWDLYRLIQGQVKVHRQSEVTKVGWKWNYFAVFSRIQGLFHKFRHCFIKFKQLSRSFQASTWCGLTKSLRQSTLSKFWLLKWGEICPNSPPPPPLGWNIQWTTFKMFSPTYIFWCHYMGFV